VLTWQVSEAVHENAPVGSVYFQVVACPAPHGHRQGTKLGVKLLGGGAVAVDGVTALDLGHVVDDLIDFA
jgi:hypothetical protein